MKFHTLFSIFLLAIITCPFTIIAQKDNGAAVTGTAQLLNAVFDSFFQPKTLRIDYLLAGDAKSEIVYFVQMKEEPFWGGPHKNLIDPFGFGTYRYSVFDSASGQLVFRRGFSSLFQEWKGTDEAKTIKRALPMSAVFPYPQKTIRFVIEKRSFETDKFELMFERFINPNDYFINHEHPHPFKFIKIKDAGNSENHVDIAFLAEGYTTLEMDKFIEDSKRIADYFLSFEPYSSYAGKFNFYAVESPSDESGVTIPGKDIYVNTNIHSSFYTFDMDRYLTTFDTKSVYDIAACVPYDMIFVLVNSKRYGGGGFYNHYGQSTVDHQLSTIVALHEFGHEFAGLADEYYTSEVTYSDYYNLRHEPWEPNITTNVNFESKWKALIDPSTPVPTPRNPQYNGVTGMFEGGGYLSKGIYSPMMDCRMKSNEAPSFCPACRRAIEKMILFYTE